MVRIQVKRVDKSDEQGEFLYDCQSTSSIEEIAEDVTQLANLQSEIRRLVLQLEPPLTLLIHTNPKVTPLMRALSEAKSYASKDQVLHNKPLSSYVLRDQIRSIEREFMVYYHIMGFPDSNLQQLLTGLEILEKDTAELWCAGKEFVRGKKLCDYIGKNEKTKIILRLQSPGSHPACNSEMDLSNKTQPCDSESELK